MGINSLFRSKKGVRGFTPCVFHKPRGRRLMILVKCSHFKTKYIIVYDQKKIFKRHILMSLYTYFKENVDMEQLSVHFNINKK